MVKTKYVLYNNELSGKIEPLIADNGDTRNSQILISQGYFFPFPKIKKFYEESNLPFPDPSSIRRFNLSYCPMGDWTGLNILDQTGSIFEEVGSLENLLQHNGNGKIH